MKLTIEEIQLKIFDLLEGNLSEAESKSVMKIIDADPIWKKEYKLLKQTYLAEDKVIFPEREKLYKRKGLVLFFTQKYRYAAALALLLSAAGIWFYISDSGTNQSESISNNHKAVEILPNTDSVIPGQNPDSDNTHTENVASGRVFSQHKGSGVKHLKTDSPEMAPTPAQLPVNVAIQPPREPIKKQSVAVATHDTAQMPSVNQPEKPVTKRRSLAYRVLRDSKAMFANLQLPQVRFVTEDNPDKNIPKVKMTISTLNTDVIATLIQ